MQSDPGAPAGRRSPWCRRAADPMGSSRGLGGAGHRPGAIQEPLRREVIDQGPEVGVRIGQNVRVRSLDAPRLVPREADESDLRSGYPPASL